MSRACQSSVSHRAPVSARRYEDRGSAAAVPVGYNGRQTARRGVGRGPGEKAKADTQSGRSGTRPSPPQQACARLVSVSLARGPLHTLYSRKKYLPRARSHTCVAKYSVGTTLETNKHAHTFWSHDHAKHSPNTSTNHTETNSAAHAADRWRCHALSAWRAGVCRRVTLVRFLGSRTSLGGYTHDPTHVTHGYDPIRRLMGVDYVIRGHCTLGGSE